MDSPPPRTATASQRAAAREPTRRSEETLRPHGLRATQFSILAALAQTGPIPVLLGYGVRLFGRIEHERIELESAQVIESPGVTHLRFRYVQ